MSRLPHGLQPVLHVDRRVIDPVLAIRHGLIVAAALGGGFVLGDPKLGFAAAMGALQVGFYDGRGPYRARLETMAAATLALAAAATLGALIHGTPGVANVLTVCVAFTGGLLTAVGPNASLAGLHSTILILVFSAVASGNPAVVGFGVLLGGALQSVVAVGAWLRRPFSAEERALAQAWSSLADLGAHRDDRRDRDALMALAGAASTLAMSSARGSRGQRLRGLLDRADWLRLELVALGRRADDGAARLRAATAVGLADLAAAVGVGIPRDAGTAEAALIGFRRAVEDPADLPPVRLAAISRELSEAAAMLDPAWYAGELTPPLRRRHNATDVVATMRSGLTVGSPLFRHAARLALAVGVSHVIAGALGLPRGYWVAMTALVVLRPDYTSTVQRGLGRVVGTFAGILIAWGAVSALTPGRAVLVTLVGLFAIATYLLIRANFTLGATALTALIACLLDAEGQPLAKTAPTRLLDTAIGGAVALAIYLLLPTWQRANLGESLARSVDASRQWAAVVLGGLADRATYDSPSGRRMGGRARQARVEAEAAVEGALGEPGRSDIDGETARAVIAANRRLNRALVSLEVVARAPSRDRPEITSPATKLDDALLAVAATLSGVPGAQTHETPDNLEVPEVDRADPVDVELGRALDAAQALLDLTRSR